MTYQYAVIGAGRQGTAAAYDLAVHGEAEHIILADYSLEVAQQAAQRINDLVQREVAEGIQLDARDYQAVVEVLKPVDVCLLGVPFIYLLDCTRAAIEARTSVVDFGGHTDTVLAQLALCAEAEAQGISIVPDCGMGPGLNNSFGVYAVEQFEVRGAIPHEIRVWDGGLPQNPDNVWGYQCSFHINGLTNEYSGQAVCLRAGKVTMVDALTEMEVIEFGELGQLEAFITSGGTSTVPYSYEGKLQVYENKTCRYPGHYTQFKAFKDLGLFGEEPMQIGDTTIIPREFYHALLAPQLTIEQVIDVCIMRARCDGALDGQAVSFIVEVTDYYDEATGFTAMERMTGFHAATMAAFIAQGAIKAGAYPLEKAISATQFLEGIRKRGFNIQEHWIA